MRKPDFCISEIKSADELGSNCATDQHLDISSLQCNSVLSTIAHVLRKMSLKIVLYNVLIFYVSFIRDLTIISEGENMQNCVINCTDF